jgi:hypothetical protein
MRVLVAFDEAYRVYVEFIAIYKMLRLRVALRPDAPPEVSGMFGEGLDVSKTETASGPRSPPPRGI